MQRCPRCGGTFPVCGASVHKGLSVALLTEALELVTLDANDVADIAIPSANRSNDLMEFWLTVGRAKLAPLELELALARSISDDHASMLLCTSILATLWVVVCVVAMSLPRRTAAEQPRLTGVDARQTSL
jgi:hypothetical protein